MYWYFTLFTLTFSMYAQELVLLCCLYQTVWERSSLTHKSLNFITPSFSLLSLTLACSRCQSASLSESHQSSAHRCDTWECCVISLTAISHWYWAYNFGEHYAHPNHMNASHYFIALLSWLRDERLFLKLELKKKKRRLYNDTFLCGLALTSQNHSGYLSVEVEGKTGNTVCVHVLQDGHGLDGVGVPHTDIWLLSHLSRGH